MITGDRYVGKRVFDAGGRWKTYLGSGIILKRAIKKYGSYSFNRVIIDYAVTGEELCDKERFWVNFYNAVNDPTFYNITQGGDGGNSRSGYSKEEFENSEKSG